MTRVWACIRFPFGWWRRHPWWAAGLCVAVVLTSLSPYVWWLVGALLAPPVLTSAWWVAMPQHYYRRSHAKRCRQAELAAVKAWPTLSRDCGLGRSVVRFQSQGGLLRSELVQSTCWDQSRLREVRAESGVLRMRVGAASGQTMAELRDGLGRLAVAYSAVTHGLRQTGPDEYTLELHFEDALASPRDAAAPSRVAVDSMCLGRAVTGAPWSLKVSGRHTLVVGCSGAGKGSVLWGTCGALAPAVAEDSARLWGVDLKRGVELGMGRGLFSAVAYTPSDAVLVMKSLLKVIDERGASMIGRSRLHEPSPGQPLHVLVIDELAALTAYGEPAVCKEANRLLGEILTQGRALGVVVLACVQDPRKEVVQLRGLFTQTIALRLRSSTEVSMVLGEGMAETAPAHRISPAQPGRGWVVVDDGQTVEVRADHWTDALIRRVAEQFPAKVSVDLGDPRDDRSHRDDDPPRARPRRTRRRGGDAA